MAYDGVLRFDAGINSKGFQKDADNLGSIVKGLGVFKIIAKGFQIITGSIDQAVSRYDTLNKFPQVLEQMGYSAAASSKATNKLAEGVQGLPTSIDEVVSTAQHLTTLTGNLEGSVDVTLALNNAFLASGSSASDASRGLTQYVQMLSTGKVDMVSWRTLQETMGYALQKTAEAFGFAGSSAQNDLYAALRDGNITFDVFNAKIIELDQGVGGFAEVAKTSTGGIGTAFTNMGTRTAAGIAEIIYALDRGLSKTRFKSIENIISTTGTNIKKALTTVAGVFEFVARNIEPLTVRVIAFAVAWKGVKLVSYTAQLGSLTAAIKHVTPALITLVAAKAKDAAATAYIHALYVQDAVVKVASTAATAANTVVTKLSTAADGGSIVAKIGLAVATKAAAVAQWLYNAAMSANPIFLIIAGIALLTAGVIALISWLNKGSAAYDKQKEEVEALSDAQEGLSSSISESSKAHEENSGELEGLAKSGQNTLTVLKGMVDENGKLTVSHEEASAAISDLNGAYEGLNLSYDEETDALSASIAEVEKYISAKSNVSKMTALDERRVELAGEQAQVEANLAEIAAKRQVIEETVTLTDREKEKLIKKLDKTTKEYGKTVDGLNLDIEANNKAIQNSTDRTANNTINRYEAVNDAQDENGNNLKQLAKLYNTTTDEILSDMEKQGISIADWSARKSEHFTEEGQSLQGVANQWGLTTDEVKGHMDEWGMSLDEFAAEMEATHTKEGLSLEQLAEKWGTTSGAILLEMDNMGGSMQDWSDQQDAAWKEYEESVKARTDGVINGFKKIPGKYEQSASEMLKVLKTNKIRYAEWETAMEEITKKLGPTAAEEFGKLGPESTSAMQEILGSADLLDKYREVFGVKLDAVTGHAVEDWNNPDFIGAPAGALDRSAQGIKGNTSLETEITEKMESTRDSAKGVDFTEVGQEIAKDISNGLNGADVSGLMQNIANAIRGGSTAITSTVSRMGTSVSAAFKSMSQQAQSTTTGMMTSVNSIIVSRTGTIKAAITNVGSGIKTAIASTSMQAVSMSEQMMADISRSIASKASSVKSTAVSVSNGIVSGLSNMVADGKGVIDEMVSGMLVAMNSKAKGLYAKAREIAENIASSMKDALEVRSPSRVMVNLFKQVMMGIYKGMEGMTGKLYREAESIALGLSERLSISPSMASETVGELRNMTTATWSKSASLVLQAAHGSAPNHVKNETNFTQYNTSPKPLSEAELTKEAQDLLRRQGWKLP